MRITDYGDANPATPSQTSTPAQIELAPVGDGAR